MLTSRHLLAVGLLLGGRTVAAVSYDILPSPVPPEFKGRIEPSLNGSVPYWPSPLEPPEGAPNVVLILIDDAGFGSTSTFGGPIPTPNFESLAQRGLRYTRFHTTALCSPTRAALLTGRNHHTVHTGTITETASGYPGYDTLRTRDTASVAEVLKLAGFNTLWTGKNHNVPDWMSSQTGPFDLWYAGMGFEHFYGFVGGDTSQWRPAMFEGVTPVEPYLGRPDYILNSDLANYTIRYMERQKALAPHKPFFVYYAPGATHAPHHVPREWIDKFKGKFDHGWDVQRERTFDRQKELGIFPESAKLTPRPKEIPAWKNTTDDQKKVYARMMEVYAAFMAHTDHEVGRVLDRIKTMGEQDNTLVFLMIGDNGASAEGTLNGLLNEMSLFSGVNEDFQKVLGEIDLLGSIATYNHYPVGWAHAMNTPFQWAKQIASHYGGVRNGLVVSWPGHITREQWGTLRTQWHHVVDIAPTILEAVRIPPPSVINGVAQRPYEGVSMLYSFMDPGAEGRRRTQYFEMFGNQGIYDKGWTAGTTPVNLPWVIIAEEGSDPITGMEWELYNVDEDPTQANNLADVYPEKLKEMRQTFYIEASECQVFPIDNGRAERLDVSTRPSLMRGRNKVTFYNGMVRTPEGTSPDLKNRDWNMTADVTILSDQDHGVIATLGGRYAGWVLHLRDGKLVFHYNFADSERYEVVSDVAVKPGQHTLSMRFDYDGKGIGLGGTASLLVDDVVVGRGRIEKTMGYRISLDETMDIGRDTGTAAAPDYDVPNAFTGELRTVTFEL